MFFLFYNTLNALIYCIYFIIFLFSFFYQRRKWGERLGFYLPKEKADILFHASSAGEILLLIPLFEYILKENLGIRIHLTVSTDTGYQTIKKNFSHERLSYSYIGLDFFIPIRRYLSFMEGKSLVICESEHWPILLSQASVRKMKLFLVNGRLSKSSYRRFKKVPKLTKKILSHYDIFFFKSVEDKNRYLSLGVSKKKIEGVGDLKFEAPIKLPSKANIENVKHYLQIPENIWLWLASSTRTTEEEEIIIRTFQNLKKIKKNLRLVLAPRHTRRLYLVKKTLEKHFVNYSLYSSRSFDRECLLIDQMGILKPFFFLSEITFVGGTMSHTGGHNILEPVWMGTPVIFGPNVDNIVDLKEYVLKNNYGVLVQNEAELFENMREFILGKKKFHKKIDNSVFEKISLVRKIEKVLLYSYK